MYVVVLVYSLQSRVFCSIIKCFFLPALAFKLHSSSYQLSIVFPHTILFQEHFAHDRAVNQSAVQGIQRKSRHNQNKRQRKRTYQIKAAYNNPNTKCIRNSYDIRKPTDAEITLELIQS